MTADRIDSLDLIRGIAILAILIMNVHSMALPPVAYWVPTWTHSAALSDVAIYWAQSLLVESRFMSMFAMLFGVGLAIQADRMRTRDVDPRPRLRRRLAWLLVFGLIHGFLLWHGDILTLYALAGFLVLPATKWRTKTLTIVAVTFILLAQIPLGLVTAGSVLTGKNLMEVPPLPFDSVAIAAARAEWTQLPSRLGANAAEFGAVLATVPLMLLWHAAGVMMIGMALYRRGFFTDRGAWRRGILSLVLGAGVGATVLAARYAVGLHSSAAQSLLGAMMLAGILMAIGYMSVLMPAASGQGLLCRALRNTGKTAFTLYIGQTVITLAVFVVALRPRWGEWSRASLLVYVLLFAVVQVVFAHLWQTRRGMGPLEHMWRRLAAGRSGGR